MAAARMLQKENWAVVGSHGRNPITYRLVNKLEGGRKTVFKVNPGVTDEQAGVLPSLSAISQPIDVVNLVINPVKGKDVVMEMSKLNIKSLWIQPGADSPEVVKMAKDLGMEVHQGCVLVESKF